MRSAILLSIVGVVAGTIGAAVPALAAEDPSTRAGTDREAQVYLAEFATCVATRKSYRDKVAAFLRLVPRSEGYGQAALRAADLHCLDAAATRTHSKITMKVPPDLFREALYPALYQRDFGKSGPPPGMSDTMPAPLSSEFDGDVAALSDEYRARRALGDCVVRASPQGANAMLVAKPFEPAEDEAIEVLKPALGGCMAEGRTLRMNRAALRAIVGESAYKLARQASAMR